MSRPFAVFDIDGTLIRWQLYHALADELARRSLLAPAAYERVRTARMDWKTRTSQTAFQHYEEMLVQLIDKTITDITVEDFQAACRSVVDVYKDQVYTYTRDRIHQLKDKGYLLFAISASQAEIVGLIAEYYGFDDFGGSYQESKGGRYTGVNQVLKRQKKPDFLRQLVVKHQAQWKGSIGIGDSESDIPMLSIVEKPTAFNPTKELFNHAKAQGWKIVLERKSVIYRLEPTHGSYCLTA